MKKIQTMWSDLSDWFYNLKNLNTIAHVINVVDNIQDKMIDDLEGVPGQIEGLYQRVRVLEIAESTRQFDALIASVEKSKKVQPVSKTKKLAKKK